jgi:hypothetical protein
MPPKKSKLSEEELSLKQKYELLRKKQAEEKAKAAAAAPSVDDTKNEQEKRIALSKLMKKNQTQEKEKKKKVLMKPQITLKIQQEQGMGFIPKVNPPNEDKEATEKSNNNDSKSKSSFYNPGEDKRFGGGNYIAREGSGFKRKRFRNSTESDYYPSTVFVGDLSETTEQHNLEELFQQYGKLEAVRIIPGKKYDH